VKIYFPYLVIAILVVMLILQRECGIPSAIVTGNDIITRTDTVIHHDTILLKGKVIYTDPVETIDCVYVYADTAQILADYNCLKIYKRLLWADSLAEITTFDTVYQNSMLGSHVEALFHIRDTTIIRTQYIREKEKARIKVFAGVQIGYAAPACLIAAPTLSVLTKKEHLYSISYDHFNKAFIFGLGWKIRLSKRPYYNTLK